MNISLIKQLNETVREKDEYELALEKAGMKSNPVEESIDDYDMDDEDLSDIDGDYGYEDDEGFDDKFQDETKFELRDRGQGGAQEMGDDLEDEMDAGMMGDPADIMDRQETIRDRVSGYENEEKLDFDSVPEHIKQQLKDMNFQSYDEFVQFMMEDNFAGSSEMSEEAMRALYDEITDETMSMSAALADGPQDDGHGNTYIP